ncbi:MAG TPA: hypothetical protein VGF56_04960 [Rhizomicrobium sp.]|jgi:Ca2+-binding RTX toxin-like protein
MGTFKGTSGDDNLSGTSGSDQFNLIQGGEDTAGGLGGNDTFTMHGTLDAGDAIDGGSGSDTVSLSGDYSAGVTFTATTIANVERILLGAGFDYKLTSDDATVAAGQTLTIDGAHLGAGDTLNFDGSAETDGKLVMTGGAGDDILKGGSAGAVFDLRAGGEDTATGGSGSDLFIVGGNLDAGDRIDGGFSIVGAHDVLRIAGDYSAGLTFGANTIQNIATLQFGAGFDYNFTVDNANFLSGPTALINAGGLGAGDSLGFDASASDANFHFIGGAGNDVLKGGTAGAYFDLSKGGDDTAVGGVRDDHFNLGGTFNAADSIDGGGGNDRVDITGLDGTDTVTFTATTMTNVASLVLGAGHNYDLVTNDATVAADATMLINGAGLGASDALTFDGTAETDGHFLIRGGAGDDSLTGGQDGDTFNLTKGGADTATGGAGNDTFNMGGAFDSDDLIDGGGGTDTLSLNGTYATPIAVSGTMVQNVETVTLAGSGYNIAWQSAIASTLTVDASTIGSGNSVIFDSTSLATGDVHFIAGAGDTEFSGGGGDDVVDLQNSADGYRISAGGGDDTVNFGASYGAGLPLVDFADGNAGSNTATFDGDYAGGLTLGVESFIIFTFGLADFQTVELLGDHSYTVTFDDTQVGGATLTGGAALTVDASALGAGDHANLDFSLSQAPGFTVTGGAGDDTLTFAGNFSASDAINGGAGNDTLELNGDYSAGLTFGAATMTNVETLKLDAGDSYDLVTNDATVASGQTLTVDASALGVGEALTFDGSAETNGFFAITGGAGDDAVKFGSHFSVADSVDGGAGNDTVTLNNVKGTYNFTDTTMTNVETLAVNTAFLQNIAITTTDANVAAGATLTVDFSPTNIALNITFDGSAEQDGHFAFIAPGIANGVVTLTGGALSDSFALGADSAISNLFNGGGGDDTLNTIALASRADFDGGTGNDTVALTGGGTESDTGLVLTSVENMTLDDNGWNVTMGNIASGDTLNVNATTLSGSHTLTFDGSEITNGARFVFSFAGNFVTADSLTGGVGNDVLALNGDYTNPLVMGASTISAIETITVADGHSYDIVSNDANVASGATLTVDGSALTGGNTLSFSGSAELDGHFAFIGGAGADVLEGGSQSDTFDLSLSDGAFVNGGGGNDTFTVTSRAFLLDDFIDGSTGSTNTLVLNGNFSTLTAITGSNVENIEALTLLGAANSYDIVFTDGITTALTVNASAAASLTFDATGDTSTAFAITGSAGNDTLTGGGKNDSFNLTGGGNDTAHGGAGNDTFSFGGAFTTADTVDGGANSDTISLSGDYSAGLTFSATNMTSVETLVLNPGHSYNLTTNDANVAAAATLNVVASSLGAGDTLTFNGAAESDGHFAITGGAGNDTLTGGAQADSFDLTTGGADTVHGGGGSDTITLGSNFSVSDAIDGGTGSDTVNLVNITGTYAFTATTIQNVEDLVITVTDGRDASFTTNDANVAAGATMIVDFSSTGPVFGNGNLTFDGSAETDGHFAFVEPANILIMTLTGGALSDTLSLTHGDTANSNNFNGLGGDDTVTTTGNASSVTFDGGTGNDTLAFTGGGTESTVEGLTSVETVTFDDNDWNVAQRFLTAAASLNVDATALSGGHTLTFNGVDTTDGPGFADESFVFEFAGNFIAGDSLTGGAGNDTLSLNGDYSAGAAFGAAQLTSIEAITVAAGHSYSLTTNDGNVASGASLTVDASALGSGNTLTFNGSAETDGSFVITGGAGNDTLQGGNGADTMTGGAGADAYVYNSASASPSDTAAHVDHITDFNGAADKFDFSIAVHFQGGDTVSAANDIGDLTFSTVVNGDFGLGFTNDAILVLVQGGALAGHTFLCVDWNNSHHYDAGDLTVDITGVTNEGSISASTFI